MARIDDLQAALKAADKAGDARAAQLLAAEISRSLEGAPTGGARPLPANSWAVTGRDPAIDGLDAAMIGAGRSADQLVQGGKQIGMNAAVAGREALGMTPDVGLLQQIAAQRAQQGEKDRLYAPLKQQYPIATGLGEAAPALAIPMGGAGVAARIATPALGMAGLESMKFGSPAERGARGATGLVSGLLGGAGSEIASRTILPIMGGTSAGMNTVAQLSEKVGARSLPSQLIDSPSLARFEDMLARSPGSAGPMQSFMQGNREAVNRTVSRAIGEDSNAVTADVMGAAKSRIGANFDALRQNATMPSSQNVFDAIDRADKWLNTGNAQASGKQEARDTVKRLKDALYGTKQFSGDEYKSWVSDLRSQAAKTENSTVAAALKEVSKAMDAEARANTAPTVVNGKPTTWADADKQWAALKTLFAPNAVNEVTGDVNPLAVARSLASRNGDAAKTGKLTGPMADVAAYGRGVPQLRAGSPTYERGEASLMGLAQAAPKWVAAKALTSPAFSEYLTKGLLGNPEASGAVAQLAGRTTFPATGGMLDAYLLSMLGLPVMAEQQ